MNDSQEAAPTQHGLQDSNKRPRSRSLSNSPSQAQPAKKTVYDLDTQDWNHMMEEPSPSPEALPFTAELDYINAYWSSPPLTDQIDSWLEETYPSEIHRRYSYSDILVQTPLQIPQARYARSAPPSMTRRITLQKRTRFSRQISTPGNTGAGSSTDQQDTFSTEAVTPVTTSVKSTGSLVEKAHYEAINLAANNIIYRDRREELPTRISRLVQKIAIDRELPDISIQDVNEDDALASLERGAGEPNVEQYIQNTLVLLPPRNGILKRSDKIPMARRTVPNTGTEYRVSGPVPDILLGYNLAGAFTPAQRMNLCSMELASANNDGLCLPYFLIELKGDGSSSCVNIAEMLNKELKERGRKVKPIDTSAFSISMNGTEARLYITWKQGQNFCVQKIRSFALQEAQQLLEFRKHVLNIMAYGRNERLESIKSGLELLSKDGSKASEKKSSTTTKSKYSDVLRRRKPY
ncbi:hypothetical protein FLAG1_06201 [Fusarium langsethiae]|uniref:DUF7924 domain-containing protein n=1 Tax=Fusarium langsethiae TaxID=179993 RepID=A0A0M9EW05_FUSLA|nr:hypothetical protein FLAG1_06201 [Fusarium langsethiae]GKU06384.1 unnamed protein product [Fusarium langsethiae]